MTLRIPALMALSLAACAEARSPAGTPVAVAPPHESRTVQAFTPAAALAPPLTQRWFEPCVVPRSGVCGLGSVATDDAGNVYVGGWTYSDAHLAGKDHPARGFEQALLASVDASGHARWSKAFGIQAHNEVGDVRVVGDRLVVTGRHGNGFDAGGKTLRPISSAPSMAAHAETGFVAAYTLDGTLVWAKNVAELANRPATDDGFDSSYQLPTRLYPDRRDGTWILHGSAGPTARVPCIAHVDLEGRVLDDDVCADGLRSVRGDTVRATLDREGNLYVAMKLVGTPALIQLLRFGRDGSVRTTALGSFARRDDSIGELHVDVDGTVFALAYTTSPGAPRPSQRCVSVLRVDSRGVLSTSPPLVVSAAVVGLDSFVRFSASTLSPEGTLRVVVAYSIPLLLGNVTLAPLPHAPMTFLDSTTTLPYPSLTMLAVDARAGTLTSYTAPAIIEGVSSLSQFIDRGSYFLGTADSAVALPPGIDGKPRVENRRVVRLE